jgi:hypothetical protein
MPWRGRVTRAVPDRQSRLMAMSSVAMIVARNAVQAALFTLRVAPLLLVVSRTTAIWPG